MNVFSRDAFSPVEAVVRRALPDDAVTRVGLTSCKDILAGGSDVNGLAPILAECGDDPAPDIASGMTRLIISSAVSLTLPGCAEDVLDLETFREFIAEALGAVIAERDSDFARHHTIPYIRYTPEGIIIVTTERELIDLILEGEARMKASGVFRVEFDILELSEARFGRQRALVLFKDYDESGRIIRLATTRFFLTDAEGMWKIEMMEFVEELFQQH